MVGSPAPYRDVALSPDGKWASITIAADTSVAGDVWLIDLARKLPRRFSFGRGGGFAAVWTPDGRRIAYSSRRESGVDLFQKGVSGTGPEELLLADATEKYPLGFSPDGRFLLYMTPTGAATGKLYVLPLSGARTPSPLSIAAGSQVPAAVSPDGKWIAYVSDESARREVYVSSFPGMVGKWQVSTEGGESPQWRADGKELFFTGLDKLMAVDVLSSDRFDSGPVRPLFDVRTPAPALGTRSTYAVSPDGQRFLFNTWDSEIALTPLTLVVNWPASMKRQP
jgi:Tol biopolymer transport system component